MSETPTALLLLGIVVLSLLFIAIVVAVLVYLNKSQRKAQPKKRAASTVAPAASSPPAPPASAPQAAPAAHPAEVMRVIHDREMGRVLVEVDGQRYAHIREIRDAAVGRRVLWAISDLVRFTGGLAISPQAAQSAQTGPAADGPGKDAASRTETASGAGTALGTQVAPPPLSPSQPPPASALPGADSVAPQQGAGLVGYLRRGFQAPPPAEPLPSPTAWIAEIDDILQRTVRELPAPPSQPVRVTSAEDGMLQIIVGTRAYGSADEVPDPEIRALIQAAVAEWEKS